jgi:hypothetical protein
MKRRATVDNCSIATAGYSTAPQSSSKGSAASRKLPPLSRDQRVSQLALRRLQLLHDRSATLKDEPDASVSTSASPEKHSGALPATKLVFERTVAAEKSARRMKLLPTDERGAAAGPGGDPERLHSDHPTDASDSDAGQYSSTSDPAASFPGLTLSLGDVPMTAEDLISVVEYLANVKPKIRSLSLTALQTPLCLAKQTVGQLTKLLERQRSIIELQISDCCELSHVHVLLLQQALDENINLAVKSEQKRRELQQQRAEERTAQRAQDELDFYYWENSNRMGIMQLQTSQRSEMARQFRAKTKIMASGAQLVFVKKLQAQERQVALDECCELKRQVAMQWLVEVWFPLWFARCVADEALFRDSINSAVAASLDELHVAKRDHHRQCKAAMQLRRDTQLAERAKTMMDEKRSRIKLKGRHLGHYVAWKMLATLRGILPARLVRRRSVVPLPPKSLSLQIDETTTLTSGREDLEPKSGYVAADADSLLGGGDEPNAEEEAEDEGIDEKLRQSVKDTRKRSVAGPDGATKIAGVVRAKSLSTKRMSLFPDLVDQSPARSQRLDEGSECSEQHAPFSAEEETPAPAGDSQTVQPSLAPDAMAAAPTEAPQPLAQDESEL